MSLFFRCGISAALAAFLFCSPSFAAEPDVIVTRGNLVGGTAPTVADARADVLKAPGGVAVVDAREFQNKYVLNLKDMLKATPGVYAQPRYGEEVRLSIRGSGIARAVHLRGVTLLQDSIPFNLADGSGDFQEIDPLLLQHVEVYRGGNALAYGSTNLGGAINMVTPSARNVDYNYLMRVDGGSFGTLRFHGATAQVYGDSDAYAAVTRSLADGYRNQSQTRNSRAYANVGTKLTQAVETRFYAMVNNIRQQVPGTLSRFDALHNPEAAVPINVTNNYGRHVQSQRFANKTSITVADGLTLDLTGFLNNKHLYHPIFDVIDQKSVDGGLSGVVRADYGAHDLRMGVAHAMGHTDAFRYSNIQGRRGGKTADADQDASNLIVFGEDRIALPHDLALTLGAQWFRASRRLENNLAPANDAERVFRGINPKIGLSWSYLPTAQAFVSLSKSREVPTFSELVQTPVVSFVPLDLQDAWTVEAGTRGAYGRYGWDLTIYRSMINDEFLQFTTSPSVPAATFNADKTVHQGIELGLDAALADFIQAGLVYNYSDFYFDGDRQYGDNQLPGIPKHVVQARVTVRPTAKISITPHVEWVPTGAKVDFANTLDVPGYAMAGVQADYKVHDNITLFFDARNLTNERAITNFSTVTDARVVGTSVFYPAEGRAAYAGFKVAF